MPTSHPVRALALAAVLAASSAVAAPVGPKTPLPKFEKYLLDDTDLVAVINVKQALGSPLFTESFKKPAETFLKGAEAQALLKDSGFDPLKDVDFAVAFTGRSSYSEKDMGNNGPLVLLFGRFDEKKLAAKAAAVAKEKDAKVKAVEAGDLKLYEVKGAGYLALLDKNTAAFTPRKEQMVELSAKAAGKKTTKLKFKEMADALKSFKADAAVQGVGLESMVTDTLVSETDDGMGKRERKVEFGTLGKAGFKGARVTATVDKDVKLTVVLTPKGKDEMKEFAKKIPEGLKETAAQGRKHAEKDKSVLPLVEALEKAKVKAADGTITLEFTGDAKVVEMLPKMLYGGRSGAAAPPPPPPVKCG